MKLRRYWLLGTLLFWLVGCGGEVSEPPPTPAPTVAMPTQSPTLNPTATAQPATAIPTANTLPITATETDFAPLLAIIEQEMGQNQVPGLAIAVVQQGVMRVSQGFGLADVTNNTPVTPATLFRIGSITKPLTAIGLLQLVEAGRVDLDAPVVSYLPEFVVSDQITVRQLLSHSSGLGDTAIPYGRTDAAALADYVASLTPASAFAPPNTVFSYSNTGFNVIGRIIEVVSGMPYVDYMTTQVFPALGMTHTTFQRETALDEGLALGYYPSRGAPTPVDRDPDYGAEYPSGFAFSSVEDLTRLAAFLLSDGLVEGEQRLSPALVQEMKREMAGVDLLGLGYGLGVLIRERDGEITLGHNGTINGYAATLEIMPSRELAVIVLSNRNNYDPTPIVQAAFERFVEPLAAPPAPVIPLDDAALSEYVGQYAMQNALPGAESEVVTVAVQGAQLTASLPGVTFELRAVGDDLFDVYVPQMDAPVTQIAFLRDATGAIQYMSFTMHALVRLQP